MKKSLVIPCYNEVHAIPAVLSGLQEAEITPGHHWEVIVVDDGSRDGSLELLEAYDWVRVISSPRNFGYGAAIKQGLFASQGEVLAFMDMDATYEPRDLPKFVNLLQKRQLHMVVGHRQSQHMPSVRWVGNGMMNLLIRGLYDDAIQDACSGMRVFRRQTFLPLLNELPDQLDFALAMTLMSLKKGYSFIEIPTQYHERLGTSKLNEMLDGLRFVHRIVKTKYGRALDLE